MSKHTLSEWHLVEIEGFEVCDTSGRVIAKIPWASSFDRSNARLIAAAPRMLAALECLRDAQCRLNLSPEDHREICAAIEEAINGRR